MGELTAFFKVFIRTNKLGGLKAFFTSWAVKVNVEKSEWVQEIRRVLESTFTNGN